MGEILGVVDNRPQLRWLPQGYPKTGRPPRHFSKLLISLVEPSGIEPLTS
jgi:hypothetical protein